MDDLDLEPGFFMLSGMKTTLKTRTGTSPCVGALQSGLRW